MYELTIGSMRTIYILTGISAGLFGELTLAEGRDS